MAIIKRLAAEWIRRQTMWETLRCARRTLGRDAEADAGNAIFRAHTLDTDSSGYHETITRAYVALITQSLAAHSGPGAPVSCAQALLAGRMASRDILPSYYSKDVLFAVTARRGWVETDRAPLSPP